MIFYNWQYHVTHPWEAIKEVYQDIKWFCQRGYRGYADCDAWAVDDYLSRLIPEMLTKLNALHYGVPNIKGMTKDKWVLVVKKIIKAFELKHKYIYSLTNISNKEERAVKEGFTLFYEWFDYLWD